MKLFLKVLAFVCLSVPLWGQGYRYDSNAFTSANNVPAGSQSTMFTVPFAKITVCAYPDNGSQPCTNTVPIYQDPALTVAATNPITADVHGRFGFWKAAGTYTFSMVTPGGEFLGTFVISLGGSGGGTGGGCSTGGIPTTNGSVTGDSSSTNCGTNNRASDTASVPANVSTFGFTNGTANAGTNVVAVGNTTAAEVTAGGSNDLVAIGDFALDCNNLRCYEGIAIGDSAANLTAGHYFIGLGSGALANSFVDNTIALGQGAAATSSSDTAGPGSTANVIALGNGAVFLHGSTDPADPAISDLTNVIGIGNGSGADVQGVSHDVVGMGNGAGANWLNGTHDVIGIGDGAASGSVSLSNPTAAVTDVVGLGDGVCSHLGDGSANVFCLGHNITSTGAISNAIGIGNGVTLETNTTTIGNSSTTALKLFGCPSGQAVEADGTGTCFTPGAGGGLSGQTTGYLPLATSATASTTSSALQDTGSSLVYHGTGVQHAFEFGASSGGLKTPVAGGAGFGTDASGNWNAYENGGSWSRLCTVGNGLCAGGGGTPAFSSLTSGTNTTAAMVVGSGASLAPTGTGTIQANNIASTVAATLPITVTGIGTTASPYTIACPTCGTSTGGTNVSQNSGATETNLPITGYMPQVCSDVSGSGTAQSCTVANTFIPQAGNCIVYKTTTANSGTGLTVNIDSLGAKSIAVGGSGGWTTTLVAGSSIPANKPMNLCYDGTNWNASGTGYVPSSTAATSAFTRTVYNSTRSPNTVYQNTTGFPIIVDVSVAASNQAATLLSDTSATPTTQRQGCTAQPGGCSMKTFVPNNSYYKVSGTSITVTNWMEWTVNTSTVTDSGELSGSRVVGTTYQNTSGSCMVLSVQSTAQTGTMTANVDASSTPTSLVFNQTPNSSSVIATFIPVPNNYYYKVGGLTLSSWREYTLSIPCTQTDIAASTTPRVALSSYMNVTGKNTMEAVLAGSTSSKFTQVIAAFPAVIPASNVGIWEGTGGGNTTDSVFSAPLDFVWTGYDNATYTINHWWEYTFN